MKTPRTTERSPAKNPAARPGDPGSRSWLGRHRGPGLIVLALALVAAAWAGWRIFGHSRPQGIRHVVLISIDTCRADHLGCYGFHRATTPSIDAVAKDAALFYRALTPVPMTTPAHSSMLTGAYPPTHGVRMNNGQRLGESSVTLATVLKQAGFRTAAFVGGFPLDAQFGLNQGFETYDCQFSRTSDRSKTVSERTADEVNRPALAWLEENARAGDGGKGFFLFLHYFDPHAPYQPPRPYAADFADDLYSGEIAYVDHCIGQVMDRLRAMGLYDNTLVIITGDHGEGLGEHGEMAHAFYIYDSTLRVPLIIRSPGGGGGRQVTGNVSLVDIVPTVLDLLGLKTPPQVQGVSLRGAIDSGTAPARERPVYAESLEAASFGCSPLNSVTEGSWKYIRAPRQELYDHKSDSLEQTNALEKEPAVGRRMRARLEGALHEMESAAVRRGTSGVDAEALRKLQGLGYMGAAAAATHSSAFDPAMEDPKDFQPTYERLQKANGLFLSKRTEEAKKELVAIIAARPTLVTAQALLAQIAIHERRLGDAAGYCQTIVAILAGSSAASKPADDGAEYVALGTLDTRNLATARCNLAVVWKEMGRIPEAIEQYELALRAAPGAAEIHFHLGQLLAAAARLTEAISQYEQVLKLRPDYAAANSNFAPAMAAARSANAALQQCQQSLQANPDDPEAHNNLGGVLKKIGRVDEAIAQFEQALKIKPEHAQAHYNLALALTQTGKGPEALAHFAQAVRINPDFTPALNNLAWLLATSEEAPLRDGAQAVRLAEHACQLDGRKSFGSLDTLAAAYAEAGRFADALAAAQEALALAKGANQPAAAADIQTRLALYRAGKPYREPPPAH